MGSFACTRIEKSNNFVECYTQWDGFEKQIKYDLTYLTKHWEEIILYLKEQQYLKNLILPEFEEWLENIENFVSKHKSNPTIESTIALLCSSSLNNHHVFPVKTINNEDILSDWNYSNPNVILNIEGKHRFKSYSKTNLDSIAMTPINKKIKLIRIVESNDENTKFNKELSIYSHLKVVDMCESEIEKLVLNLPLFLLELYIIGRQMVESEEIIKYKKNPIFNMINNSIFQSFYSTNENYSSFVSGKVNNYETLLKNMQALIPLELSTHSLSTHLYLASGGKILPLTLGEEKWLNNEQEKPLMQLNLHNAENRTSIITMHTENMKKDNNWLIKFIEENAMRFKQLIMQTYPDFKINNEFSINFLGEKNNKVGYNYEKNMIGYFHLLTSIDHNLS